VAADASRKRELLEKLLEPDRVFALVCVDFGIGALKINRAEDSRRAVTGTGKEDHVHVVFLNQPVQVNVHERQPRARSPMSEKSVLDVFGLERLS
jgi:hypothetical protein